MLFSTNITKRKGGFLLASFFFFLGLTSCEEPNDGLGFDQVIGGTTSADSMHIPLVSYTQKIDSIIVAGYSSTAGSHVLYTSEKLLGYRADLDFGIERADVIAEMLPEQLNLDMGSNPLVDSVQLYLRVNTAYGDTSEALDIQVFELAEPLDAEEDYYSNYMPSLGVQIGGSSNILAQPFTPRMVEDRELVGVIKIPMDKSYFQSKIASIADGNAQSFSSFSNFLDYFYGIALVANQGGSIMQINLDNSSSFLRVYYHNDDDTASINFNFLRDKSVEPLFLNHYEQDYSASSIPTSPDTINGEATTYMQSMGGVVTALKFNNEILDSIRQEGLIINSAWVEIETQPSTNASAQGPARVVLRELGNRSIGSVIRDFTTEGNSNGVFDDGFLRQNKYRLNVTRHLFETLNSGTNPTLGVVPFSSNLWASRAIFQGTQSSNSRLIIYYTKP